MLERKQNQPRGILHLPNVENIPWLERFEPCDELGLLVEHYWAVTWNDMPPTVRETIPHPAIHLVVELGGSKVHGVFRERFARTIEGTGRVLGVRFLPGGFRPFLGRPVSTITGEQVAPSDIWGEVFSEVESQSLERESAEDAFQVIDRFLAERVTNELSDRVVEVTRLVHQIRDDRRIKRVAELKASIGLRQLQRRFLEFVGISPKETIQRYRLIEAAESIREQQQIDFSSLSLDLGYSDQAHFIRDFKRMVGLTPRAYAEKMAAESETK